MKNKETEKFLLNDKNYEKFLYNKTETEFNQILEDCKKNTQKVIKNFDDVPKNMIFSKDTIYMVINKTSKTKSYVNGIQAEGFIESNLVREKLLNGSIDYFVSGDNYIKFYKSRLCADL